MPVYDLICTRCGYQYEVICKAEDRNSQWCENCGASMECQVSAPSFKFAGRTAQGGGPDRFTADMLGCRVDELPSGLRTK